jgi:hypothetical protein
MPQNPSLGCFSENKQVCMTFYLDSYSLGTPNSVRGKLCCSPSQYPLNKAFLFSWNCPFKKLFSSHKYVCVCLTMCSPLKEVYDFNKNITTLRVKMVKRVRKTSRVKAIKRVRKTKKSPED